ncbi:MAG: tetratricopeptide repeat protein, partial [Kofleriaceae bacterium]|nr:tetratricopeptide repeat protein [Kofleriaceae bacterium]
MGLSLVISTMALASPLGCGGQARPVAVKPPVAAVPVLSADAYAHYLKGQVAAFEGRTTQAVKHFRLAQHAAPNEAPIHLELVKFLHVVGSYNEALQEISHAQKQWPKNPQVWLRAGMLARSLHRYPSALTNFQRATSLGEQSEQLALTYGSVLTDSRRFPEARRVYEKALEFHPSSTALHYQLAKLDYQYSEGEKSLNTAITRLTSLLQQSPFSIESWALLALCHYQQGSTEFGDKALRTPFDRSEGSLWAAESLFETLLDLERTSGPQAPSNRLSEVLDRADLLPDTRISIAHWHLRLGNFAIALELSDKLNTFAEASGAIAELRSLALQGLGRNAEAESALRVIRKNSSTYSLIQAMLGRLVARQGRTGEARQVLIDAQNLVSENADLDFAQAFVEELAGDPTKAR